jgi:hypothetical protein
MELLGKLERWRYGIGKVDDDHLRRAGAGNTVLLEATVKPIFF